MTHGFRTARLSLIMLATAVGPLAACGGGDDGSQALADAIAQEMQSSDDGVAMSPTEAQCAADKVVAGIGVDRFKELGVTAETPDFESEATDLTPEETTVLVDSFFACIDVRGLLTDQLETTMGGSEAATCVLDKIDDDQLKAIFAAGLTGEEPSGDVMDAFTSASETCAAG